MPRKIIVSFIAIFFFLFGCSAKPEQKDSGNEIIESETGEKKETDTKEKATPAAEPEEATPKKENREEEKQVIRKPDEEIAREVIDGKWGSGSKRREALLSAGYDPDAIQKLVNQYYAEKKDTTKKESTPFDLDDIRSTDYMMLPYYEFVKDKEGEKELRKLADSLTPGNAVYFDSWLMFKDIVNLKESDFEEENYYRVMFLYHLSGEAQDDNYYVLLGRLSRDENGKISAGLIEKDRLKDTNIDSVLRPSYREYLFSKGVEYRYKERIGILNGVKSKTPLYLNPSESSPIISYYPMSEDGTGQGRDVYGTVENEEGKWLYLETGYGYMKFDEDNLISYEAFDSAWWND